MTTSPWATLSMRMRAVDEVQPERDERVERAGDQRREQQLARTAASSIDRQAPGRAAHQPFFGSNLPVAIDFGQTICSLPFWYCTKAVGVIAFCTPSKLHLAVDRLERLLADDRRGSSPCRARLAPPRSRRISSDIHGQRRVEEVRVFAELLDVGVVERLRALPVGARRPVRDRHHAFGRRRRPPPSAKKASLGPMATNWNGAFSPSSLACLA